MQSSGGPAEGDFSQYRHDPVRFVREHLGVEPWERQQQIMQSVAENRRTAVRSCNHSGKTFAAACIVHWFIRAFNPSLILTTAPTDRQMRELLWSEIEKMQNRIALPGRMTETSLQISPTQRAFGFSTNKPERFQGWHEQNILVIVDEASGVGEQIYDAIEGTLTGPNAVELLIGNPNNPMGQFFEAFRSGLYEKFHISAYDVPEHLLPNAWAEQRLREWGDTSPSYQVRVMGNFPEEGDDTLIPLGWAERAQERPAEENGPLEFGMDVAEMGGDESVVYVRRGQKVVAWDSWRGHNPLESADRMIRLYGHFAPEPATMKLDDIGIGSGTKAALERHFSGTDVTVIGINVGTSPRDREKYQMLRDEIFMGLRERFRTNDISIPKDDTLTDQLSHLKYDYLPTGKIKVESKADLKKRRPPGRGWQSPDRADALALCFAPPPPQPFLHASAGPKRPAW